MSDIYLGQVVSATVAGAVAPTRTPLKRTAVQQPADDPNFRAPKRTKIPVPDHLKFYHLPDDPRKFIAELLPNIQSYAEAYLRCAPMRLTLEEGVQDVVVRLTKYMLETAPSDGNIERWKRYQPNNKIPYFKWFLKHTVFLVRDLLREQAQDSYRYGVTLSETNYDDTAGTPGNNAMNLDRMVADGEVGAMAFAMQAQTVSPDVLLMAKELDTVFRELSAQHDGRVCFEANSYRMLQLWMQEARKDEYVDEFGISMSAVGQWQDKLLATLGLFGSEGPSAVLSPARRTRAYAAYAAKKAERTGPARAVAA